MMLFREYVSRSVGLFAFFLTIALCGCYTGGNVGAREVSEYRPNRNTVASQTRPVATPRPAAPVSAPVESVFKPRPTNLLPSLDAGTATSVTSANRWRALLVGVSDYQSPELSDLPAVEHDLASIDELLRSEFVFHEVVTLFNAEATEKNLRRELNRLRQEATQEDNILIYFGGHGTNPERRAGVWVMSDTTDLDAEGFSYALLQDFMVYCKARRILVLADSCYSGAMVTRAVSEVGQESLVVDQDEMAYMNTELVSNNRAAREIISSGNIEQVADQIPGPCSPHSPFACSLINALEAVPPGAVMSSDDLFYELTDRMRGLAVYLPPGPGGRPQTPQFIRGDGDQSGKFLLMRRRR